MNRIMRTVLIALFSLAATAVFAQEDFSADIVNHKSDGNSNTAKIYVTRDKMRFESQERSGHSGVVIINLVTQTSDILMSEQKMYMEFANGQGPGAQRTWNLFRARDNDNACSDWLKLPYNQGGTCSKVGSETVNGRSTIKYQGTNAKGETSYVWLDPKIAFPIKWQGANGAGGELQNIQAGAQPSSLFEIPVGFRKMELPAGMPNMQRPQ